MWNSRSNIFWSCGLRAYLGNIWALVGAQVVMRLTMSAATMLISAVTFGGKALLSLDVPVHGTTQFHCSHVFDCISYTLTTY